MNITLLTGRITKDPQLQYTKNNYPVCRFTLACRRPLSGSARREKLESNEPTTDFISCVIWGDRALTFVKLCKKSSHVSIRGYLENSTYVDRAGITRYPTSLHVESFELNFPPKGYEESCAEEDDNAYSEYFRQENHTPQGDSQRGTYPQRG